MKSLHRGKAIDGYKGARLVMKSGLVYPAYVLLKESLRATLSYIQEDIQGKEISNKTKLKTLINDSPVVLAPNVNLEVFDIMLELEGNGLDAIMSVDIGELEKVRKALKQIISMYLGENL